MNKKLIKYCLIYLFAIFALSKIVKAESIIVFKPVIYPSTTFIGLASFYSDYYEGRLMANGHRFHQDKMIAASYYYDLGTVVKVTNLINGHSVIVTITDRGPNKQLKHRVIDLSKRAFRRIDHLRDGLEEVKIEVIN